MKLRDLLKTISEEYSVEIYIVGTKTVIVYDGKLKNLKNYALLELEVVELNAQHTSRENYFEIYVA